MPVATIKDIAKLLRVSAATVSRALRDSHEISAPTKEKVRNAARQLNYFPNPYASSLRKGRSKTIAVVLPEVADSFFSLAINGIEAIAKEKGYHVLIYLTHESMEREVEILNEFKSGRVDGILISVSKETNCSQHITNTMEMGLPIVFFDRKLPDVNAAKVITDDYESSYIATSHLIKKGCTNIHFITISRELYMAQKREEGYLAALLDNGLFPSKEKIVICNDTDEHNQRKIKKLFTGKLPPDGIIAAVEKIIPLVYLVTNKMGIKIPDAVKVIGFTNLETAKILNPSLTTIVQPAFQMGKTAATLLFKGIEKKNYDLSSDRLVLPSILIERESTQ
jgi:LacI family transcriptional regulator